jgi:U3 small nucleolar RNA-associated protein 3
MSDSSSALKRRRAPEDLQELGVQAKKAHKVVKSLRGESGSGDGSSNNRVYDRNIGVVSANDSGNSKSNSISKLINKKKSKLNSSSGSGNNSSRYEKLRANDSDDDDDDYEDSGNLPSKEEDSSANLVEQFAAMKKKLLKKKEDKYTVEPKYGGWEDSVGIDERRGINYQIQKNKGLTPHRKKENRNARVKKRNQYENAKMRRRGQVQEVRTGVGSYYDGELTGIKSDVSKSRKFKN